MPHGAGMIRAARALTTSRTVVVGETTIVVREHFFDNAPVPQPRVGGRVADRTGLKVWPCAEPLLRLLVPKIEAWAAARGRPPNILELGSGCGLLGVGLAKATAATVVLTDPDLVTNFFVGGAPASTLDFLRETIALNAAPRASAERLVWADSGDVRAVVEKSGPFDVVVGSDLLYDRAAFAPLVATLGAVGAGTALTGYFGYPVRSGAEGLFVGLAEEAGFAAADEPLAGGSLGRVAVATTLTRAR